MTRKQLRLQYLLLFLFPAAFFVLQVLLKTDYKYFFLSSHDPAYPYLLNGLNLAQGNMQLGLTTHPGTPLHCLIALNLIIINLFSGGSPLSEAVLNNPEYFLHIISGEIILINTMALLILGLLSYKSIGNLPLSWALQLTPFISFQGICFDSAVMLEPLLLCIEIFLLLPLVNYAYGQNRNLAGKNLIIIAVLIALGIATKIVSLPLFFLPFFAVEGIRNRLIYFGTVVLSFAVFLIPIYMVIPAFFAWISALFMHTGIYGSGEATIIDFHNMAENLGLIAGSNYLFTACFICVMFTALVSFLPRFKPGIATKKRKMILGLAVVFLLNVLMVAKHFSIHYLIISHNLVAFGFILVLSVYADLNVFKNNVLKRESLKVILVFIVGALLLFTLVHRIHFSPSLVNPRLKAMEFVEKSVKNTPRIIVLENSGPFIETALFQGYAYSGGMKPRYAQILKKKYPVTYFYNLRQDIFFDWKKEFNLTDLLSRSNSTFLYYLSKHDTFPPVLLARLDRLISQNYVLSLKTAYKDTVAKEYIYEINVGIPELAGKIIRYEVAFCPFEKITPNGTCFISGDTLVEFDKAYLRSAEASFSGCFSIRLNKENPYGPGIKIIAKRGFYEINAMRHTNDGNGLIVATGKTGSGFYKAIAIADAKVNGWESLGLTFDIPENMVGEEISIYLWYPGNGTCFFDDLMISYFEVL